MTKEEKVKNRVGDKSLTITRNIVRIFLVIWTNPLKTNPLQHWSAVLYCILLD